MDGIAGETKYKGATKKMIKFETNDVWGFEWAFKGMRNPMNSWDKSDSDWLFQEIGENDLALARKLINAGSEHRKFLRQIYVSVDITAPMFWWAEYDTYKVGTVRNSCSKMHKIHVKPFEYDDFSHEGIDECGDFVKDVFKVIIEQCEVLRKKFNATQEKKYWRALIEMLPESYNMRATVTMTYENIYTMRRQRKGHKLDEWSVGFFNWSDELPHLKELFD